MSTQSSSAIISYAMGIPFLILTILILMIQSNRIYYAKNKGDIWLNAWSTSTIILFGCCITFAMLHKTQYICTKTYPLGTISWVSSLYTLTMYQTRRLQYTFNTQFKSTCVESLGYPPKLFVVLYSYGTVLLFCCIIYFSKYAYGVKDHGSSGCQHLFEPNYHIIATTLLSILLLWDWTVLALYIRKFCHLTTNKNQDDNTTKANYIVRKILFLTLLFEVSSIINVMTFRFSNNPSISTAVYQLNNFISVIFIFCMIQRNDDFYRRFVCCCLSKLLFIQETKYLIKDFQSVSIKNMNNDEDEQQEEEDEEDQQCDDKVSESLNVLLPLSELKVIKTENINIISNEQIDIQSKSPTTTTTIFSSTTSQKTGTSVSFKYSHISKTNDLIA